MSDLADLSDLGVTPKRMHMRLADTIGQSIVRGDIQPGEALPPELQLCEMMKVSRSAVRDALRVLVGKGLIQSRPKSGTRVCDAERWNHLDPDVLRWQLEIADLDDYLRKLFQLRFGVEPVASAVASRSATADDIKAIEIAFKGMAAATSNEAYATSDIEFHKGIYRATHNQFFWPIAHMFEFALQESFRISAPGGHRDRAIVDHGKLFEAIRDRKPEDAEAATLVLLRNTTKDLEVILGRSIFAGAV